MIPSHNLDQEGSHMRQSKIGPTTISAALALAAILSQLSATALAQQEPFHAGKTMRIITGFAPGGTIDLRARLFARYLPKYIPGNPSIIVQNMTGAGGQVAANYTFNVAKPDGLTFLHSPTGAIMNAFLAPESVQYDVRQVSVLWVGADSWITVVNPKASQVKKAEDLLRSRVHLRAGGTGVTSLRTLRPKLALELFGVEHTLVTGYKGSSDLLLALEKGEIHLFEDPQDGYKTNVQPKEKEGSAAVIWQTGTLAADDTFKRSAILAHVPTLAEVLPKEKKTGVAWEAWKAAVVPQSFQYLVAVAPGVPADRVAILTHGLEKMTQDPAFREDFERVLGEAPEVLFGEQADRVVKIAIKRLFDDYQAGVQYLRDMPKKK
jgi:tripartite-type tricarboxylate transporter receptor subunit TctC